MDSEQKKAYDKAWRAKNLDRIRETNRTYRLKNPESVKRWQANSRSRQDKQKAVDYQLMYKYGLTPDQRDSMFEAQGRACANTGCKRTTPWNKKGWHIDHNHATGKVRAILCHGCNIALGSLEECTERMRGLIEYVRAHEGAA